MRGQTQLLSTSAMPAAGHGCQWANAMGSLCRISDLSKQAALEWIPADSEMRDGIIRQVWALRRQVYETIYPEVQTIEEDPFDESACVIFTQDAQGEVTSTARMAFDGVRGIPEAALAAELVAGYREAHVRFGEIGRFVISERARGVLPNYYRAYYELGCAFGLDLFLIFVPSNKIDLYRRWMDAEVVRRFEGLTFGGAHEYVAMEWWLRKTQPKFFRWSGARPAQVAAAPAGGQPS